MCPRRLGWRCSSFQRERQARVHIQRLTYKPRAESHAIYNQLFKEDQALHDYFGRGANDVTKRLKALKMQHSAKQRVPVRRLRDINPKRSDLGRSIPVYLTAIDDEFGAEIPCVPYVDNVGNHIGEAILKHIGKAPAILLARHGAFAWGNDAARRVESRGDA